MAKNQVVAGNKLIQVMLHIRTHRRLRRRNDCHQRSIHNLLNHCNTKQLLSLYPATKMPFAKKIFFSAAYAKKTNNILVNVFPTNIIRTTASGIWCCWMVTRRASSV